MKYTTEKLLPNKLPDLETTSWKKIFWTYEVQKIHLPRIFPMVDGETNSAGAMKFALLAPGCEFYSVATQQSCLLLQGTEILHRKSVYSEAVVRHMRRGYKWLSVNQN